MDRHASTLIELDKQRTLLVEGTLESKEKACAIEICYAVRRIVNDMLEMHMSSTSLDNVRHLSYSCERTIIAMKDDVRKLKVPKVVKDVVRLLADILRNG